MTLRFFVARAIMTLRFFVARLNVYYVFLLSEIHGCLDSAADHHTVYPGPRVSVVDEVPFGVTCHSKNLFSRGAYYWKSKN